MTQLELARMRADQKQTASGSGGEDESPRDGCADEPERRAGATCEGVVGVSAADHAGRRRRRCCRSGTRRAGRSGSVRGRVWRRARRSKAP